MKKALPLTLSYLFLEQKGREEKLHVRACLISCRQIAARFFFDFDAPWWKENFFFFCCCWDENHDVEFWFGDDVVVITRPPTYLINSRARRRRVFKKRIMAVCFAISQQPALVLITLLCIHLDTPRSWRHSHNPRRSIIITQPKTHTPIRPSATNSTQISQNPQPCLISARWDYFIGFFYYKCVQSTENLNFYFQRVVENKNLFAAGFIWYNLRTREIDLF